MAPAALARLPPSRAGTPLLPGRLQVPHPELGGYSSVGIQCIKMLSPHRRGCRYLRKETAAVEPTQAPAYFLARESHTK